MVTRSFDEIKDDAVGELRQLASEAWTAYRELAMPGWGSKDRHGFPRTLYGHLMGAFSFVDLLPTYQPAPEPTQARRMRRFMVDHLAISDLVSRLSVQLWRNTLMHTALPRPIRDLDTGHEVVWLLHWADHLPRSQHMTVIDGHHGGQLILNTGVLYLIDDLCTGSEAMFDDYARLSTDRQRVELCHDAMLAKQTSKL